MWGITPVPGAKTELREKLIELLYNDCTPGPLLAVVMNEACQHQLDGDKKVKMNKTSKKTMAVEFYDAVRSGGLNIGGALVNLGLARPESGERSSREGGEDYIKIRRGRDRSDVIKVPRNLQRIVRKDIDRV